MAENHKNRSLLLLRELLNDYKEIGLPTAVWTEDFHTDGIIGHVGKHFVTIIPGINNGTVFGVFVESNDNDSSNDTVNKMHIPLRKIVAVSDGDTT